MKKQSNTTPLKEHNNTLAKLDLKVKDIDKMSDKEFKGTILKETQ